MGYRSEVAIKVYGNEEKMVDFKKAYDEAYTKLPELEQGWINDCIKADARNGFCGGIFTFVAEDVKWYEEYVNVAFFTELLEKVDDLGVNSEFIRIGESDGDIETEYQGDDCEYYLGVIRMIDGI
jgi:hypothetical protein